jgi:hypothetical protein
MKVLVKLFFLYNYYHLGIWKRQGNKKYMHFLWGNLLQNERFEDRNEEWGIPIDLSFVSRVDEAGLMSCPPVHLVALSYLVSQSEYWLLILLVSSLCQSLLAMDA